MWVVNGQQKYDTVHLRTRISNLVLFQMKIWQFVPSTWKEKNFKKSTKKRKQKENFLCIEVKIVGQK